MKIKYLISLLVCAGVFLLVPVSTFAYFTTAQTAVRLNDETFLYTIKYSFGTLKYDMLLPITAIRKKSEVASEGQLGYSLVNGNTEVVDGSSTAFVLSSADIKDNQYFIPKGTGREMTLFSLVTLSKESQKSLGKLSLQVTSLPFTLVDGDKKSKNHLNPTELQYYITPSIKFHQN